MRRPILHHLLHPISFNRRPSCNEHEIEHMLVSSVTEIFTRVLA
jgi:hypothetical protein